MKHTSLYIRFTDERVSQILLHQEVDNLYLSIFELQTIIGGLEDQITLSKQVYDAVSVQDTFMYFNIPQHC